MSESQFRWLVITFGYFIWGFWFSFNIFFRLQYDAFISYFHSINPYKKKQFAILENAWCAPLENYLLLWRVCVLLGIFWCRWTAILWGVHRRWRLLQREKMGDLIASSKCTLRWRWNKWSHLLLYFYQLRHRRRDFNNNLHIFHWTTLHGLTFT